MSEENNQEQDSQLALAENPLDLATGTPLPNNRPIASNQDEDIDDFVGYMD